MESSIAAAIAIAALGLALSYAGIPVGYGIGIYLVFDAINTLLVQFTPLEAFKEYITGFTRFVGFVTTVLYFRRRRSREIIEALMGYSLCLAGGYSGFLIVDVLFGKLFDAMRVFLPSPEEIGAIIMALIAPMPLAPIVGASVIIFSITVAQLLVAITSAAFTALHRRAVELIDVALPRPYAALAALSLGCLLSYPVIMSLIVYLWVVANGIIVFLVTQVKNVIEGKLIAVALDALTSIGVSLLSGMIIQNISRSVLRSLRKTGGRPGLGLVVAAFATLAVFSIPLTWGALAAFAMSCVLAIAAYIVKGGAQRLATYSFMLGEMVFLGGVALHIRRVIIEVSSSLRKILPF